MSKELIQPKEKQSETLASGAHGSETPIPAPTDQKNDEIQLFKKILEYFVGHMKYICKEKHVDFGPSGPEPIQSLPDGVHAGKGADGDKIQEYMEETAQVRGHNSFSCMADKDQRIYITIMSSGRGYRGGSYLHLVTENKEIKQRISNNDASTNINPVFNNDVFDSLEVGPSQNKPTYVFPSLKYSFDELGLGNQNPTAQQDFNLHIFFNYFIEMRNQELMGSLTFRGMNQLVATHNMILTGAPGTGKTWSAKNIASWMICGMPYEKLDKLEKDNVVRKAFDNQCKIVQFHPSYDYTDFVEGLRPTTDDKIDNETVTRDNADLPNDAIEEQPVKNQIGFKRVNGVFKEFCKGAISEWGNCHSKIEELLKDKCIIKDKINIVLNGIKKGTDGFTLETDVNFEGRFESKDPEGANNTKKVVEKATTKFAKKYVFIIDEINRGELNKIFGELFYSIDPGYRGEDGRVFTQYQNMVPKGDPFDIEKGGFYVPDNVYIIGTMNDIDRSVESMDFAMRRRFSFIEVKANERMDMWTEDWKDLAQACMKAVNDIIEDLPGLSSAYHIGPAYFKKLNDYIEQHGDDYPDFFKLWDNHLYGVIFEYLRGKKDAEKTIIEVQDAYLGALIESVSKRFNNKGLWGSIKLEELANLLQISQPVPTQTRKETVVKEYLNGGKDSSFSLSAFLSKKREEKHNKDKQQTQADNNDEFSEENNDNQETLMSNEILKLSNRLKYVMNIGAGTHNKPMI